MGRPGLVRVFRRHCSASDEPHVRWVWVFDGDPVDRDAERADLALDYCVPCWVANWRHSVAADAPEEPKMTELVAAVVIVDENVM